MYVPFRLPLLLQLLIFPFVNVRMFYLPFVAVALSAAVTSVSAVAYTISWQNQGYTGVWLERYNNLFKGNPRSLAYSAGQGDLAHSLGELCSGALTNWAVPGNNSPGSWSFNCIHPVSEINANVNNVGYNIGGLNYNGVTIASCFVAQHTWELCDSDTGGGNHCLTYLICQ